jgi:hypothetical protein
MSNNVVRSRVKGKDNADVLTDAMRVYEEVTSATNRFRAQNNLSACPLRLLCDADAHEQREQYEYC